MVDGYELLTLEVCDVCEEVTPEDGRRLCADCERDDLADRPGDLTGDDYDRLFGPPMPGEGLDELDPGEVATG